MANSLMEDSCRPPEKADRLAPERWAAGSRSARVIAGWIS